MMKHSALLGIAATIATAGFAPAAVVDTYSRTDGTPVTDSVGQTEVGGLDYIERGNSPSATTVNGTAEISGQELLIYGRQGPGVNDTGGVFLPDYNSPDLSLSADVRFAHNIAAPGSTEELANTFFVALRSRSGMNFTTTSADDEGLLAVEIGPNGDILVRENRNGTLSSVAGASGNPFSGAGTTRRRNAGALPATFNGVAFDADQDGFIDGDESFRFGIELAGTELKLFVNGAQILSTFTLTETQGLNGNGLGLHKNRVAAAFETASDVYVDNLDVTPFPIPEPGSFGLLAGAGLILASRRRRGAR